MKASDNKFPKLILTEGAAPATPDAGTVKVYAKTDGAVYAMDDTGAETPLGGGIPDAPSDGSTYGRKDGAWAVVAGGGGSGDVVGPAGAVDNRIAVFDGTTGKLIKDGGVTVAELVTQARVSPENVKTGTSYTLVLSDAFKLVAMNNSSPNTLTVPPNSSVAFPIGTRIDISQDGAGQTTVAAGAGVTIRTPETMKLRKQWAKATLIKRATNTWDLEGNLEAAT